MVKCVKKLKEMTYKEGKEGYVKGKEGKEKWILNIRR